MTQFLGIGIGAGLVSALLFGVLLKATALAILLYLLAPLPILIVGLGWSHRAALVAAVTGALALAVVVQPFLGLGFFAYLALPAWWLAYLALLGRASADGTMEWYPTGRLLAWTAGTAGLAFVAIAVIAAPNYETFQSQLRGMTRTLIQVRADRAANPGAPVPKPAAPETGAEAPAEPGPQDPAETTRTEVANALAAIAPGLATHGITVLLTFYLWAAARIVRISGRLLRPWPDLAATMMPRRVLGVLAGA
ncbi:hypothetical protein, partial [Methylobacterium goesingense]|uniref:hypothetical protein n=1 Tax=Methylobacterium goesingense TaxID=243690 RepID=UPI0036288E7B